MTHENRSISFQIIPWLAVVLILAAFSTVEVFAQTAETSKAEAEGTAKGPLSPEQTLVRYRIGDLRLSPDGRSIALSVTEPVEGTKSNS
ncbi:MAG: hypothetical protein GY906_10455, partial [bacterium]|nr:hypothetical protein [bacterium]